MRPTQRFLAAVVVLYAAAVVAKAAAATAPAAKPDAPPVVIAAVKSLDDLDAFARDTGLTLPAYLTPQGIEEKLAFITPGGLVRDKPIGVAVGGTPNFKPDQNWAFILPLRPRVATLEALKVGDAKPVPGHPDAVSWGAGTFRRTPDDLVFGPLPEVVTGLKPEAVADAVKGPNAVARIVVDLKAMRRSMPQAFNALFAQADKAAADPAQAALARVFITPLREKLDRIEVGLDRSKDSVHLLATFEPVTVPKPGKFPRPGLPAGTFARLDLSVPPAQSFPAVDADLLRQALQSGGGPDGKKLSPAKQRELANFLTKVAGLFLGGDATTVGVGPTVAAGGDAPAVYVVIQYTKDVDFVAGLKGLADDARRYDAAELPADRAEVAVENYAARDGSRVTRVRMKGSKPGDRPVYLDAVQKGRTVLLAGGASDAHAAMDGLLAAAAKPDGEMKAVAEGWFDLGAVANAAAGLGKDAAGAFKGQRVTWTAGASGVAGTPGLTIDVTAPPAVVTAVGKLLAGADAQPAKPPAAQRPPVRGTGL